MAKRLIFTVIAWVSILIGPALSDENKWDEQIAYQRGLEAVIWAMPAVSMMSLRDGNFALGGDYNTIYYLTEPPTADLEAITANNQTPYATIHLNSKNGPVILEVPPASERVAIFGSATDVWQVPIADIGPAGLDQGKGGRYLFIPPGYKDKIPEGYFVIPMTQYEVFVALRMIPLGSTSFGDAAKYATKLKAYPLSEAMNPPANNFVNMTGSQLATLPVYDIRYFEMIAKLLNDEPLRERDKVMGGMLASIGIETGKPFKPDTAMTETLKRAIADGYEYLEYMFETPGYSTEIFWPGKQWLTIRQPSKEGFVYDEGIATLLDERAAAFHWLTFLPRQLGKATAYILTVRDSDGTLLSGQGRYKLRVPANVPARDFWSVIAYNKNTKAFIYNDANRVGLSSYDADSMKINADGSVDIYFGETAPKGRESNWIPTAGTDFFLLFRLYGPQENYFDKSFILPDLTRLDKAKSSSKRKSSMKGGKGMMKDTNGMMPKN